MRYILTDEQIKAVEDWLSSFDDIDESEKIGKTAKKLKEFYFPYLGDAPFEFDDTFITNPLFTQNGLPLHTYENACEHYGFENVNTYFAKVLEHRFGIEAKEDKEEIIESSVDKNVKKTPVFKDNDITIYEFDDIDELDNIVKDEVDVKSYLYETEGRFLLITANDLADDDFVAEGEDIYVINLIDGSCFSNNSNEDLESLRANLSKEAWAFIDDKLKNEGIYNTCGLKDKPADFNLSTTIKLEDLEDYFRDAKSNRANDVVMGRIAYEVLNNDYQPEIYFDPSYLGDLVDDISEDNLKKLYDEFKVTKDDIKKIATSNETFIENEDKVYKIIVDSLYNIFYNSEQSNLLEDVIEGVKKCFPDYFIPFLEINSDGVNIINCPKSVLSKLLDEFIEDNEAYQYLHDLYQTDLETLIGSMIRDNLYIRERYNYQDYDQNQFNDMIDTLIYEQ